ncbi:MAG: polymer-forming cytoskeletal protein [Anaerolineales bacterium]|nr:polymer-forming cytoskeletal protein [Anaerolineales bacterium]
MKLSKWMAAGLLALMVLLALPGIAYAAPAELPAFDEVVFGRDFTLASGRTINGDLVVLGGSLTMEGDSTVTGQAVVIGGDATIYGHVRGDLVVVGGTAYLQETAVINGDLIAPGGNIQALTGSRVDGTQVDDMRLPWGDGQWRDRGYNYDYDYNYTPSGGVVGQVARGIGGDFVWLLFRSVAMATVALLAVLFAQQPMRRVADAVISQPAMAGGYGLLAVILAGAAIIGLSLTLILIPVAILVPFVLVTAWAFGWISLGQEVGHRLAEAFKATWSPALEASLGTFALTFATGIVSFLPCVGWLLGAIVGLAGLGAVILSRFGSQDYTGPASAAVQPLAPAPALPAPRKRAAAKKTPAKKTTRGR